MRNPSLPLSTEQAAVVARWSLVLFGYIGTDLPVRVNYIKRNGETSSAYGPLTEIKGKDSTLAVMVADNSKPYASTVNVYNITEMIVPVLGTDWNVR